MRHVVVMALSGSAGLMFMFLVDLATLFWVSQIGIERLVATVGFVWTIQFFTISIGIGLGIATTALVSRALGQGDGRRAREAATSAIVITASLLITVAITVLFYRQELVALAGATNETAEIAERFLLFSVPGLPMVGLAITSAATLRAAGDAYRSMAVTFSAGLVAVFLDPLFIFGFGLGIDGAAMVVTLSRTLSGLLGLYFVVRIHNLAARPSLSSVRLVFPALFVIAGPAILTQLAGPFANGFVTHSVAAFGDAAVAGWSVASRINLVAFGGLFALSTAIGGIFGQNYGASRLDRVRETYLNAMIYCTIYVTITWIALIALNAWLSDVFNLSPAGAEIVATFAWIGAGATVFYGVLSVAATAFNTLGRPLWATGLSWFRDAVCLVPLVWWATHVFGAPGAIYGQAGAIVIVGVLGGVLGWRFVNRLTPLVAHKTAPTS